MTPDLPPMSNTELEELREQYCGPYDVNFKRLLDEVDSRGRAIEALSDRCTAKGLELDRVIRERNAARKALAENVAEYDREIASLTPPTTMSREDEEFRDLARAEAAEARRCLEAFDAAIAAPETINAPAVEALGAVDPSNADTGRGTGVREAQGSTQESAT